MFTVKAYTIWNTTHEWNVESLNKAREFAKRMIMEGLWYHVEETEVFVPVVHIIKVTIKPSSRDEGVAR